MVQAGTFDTTFNSNHNGDAFVVKPNATGSAPGYVEFLLIKHGRRTVRTLRQDWAGALREHREQYTSLELQHQALDWRGD